MPASITTFPGADGALTYTSLGDPGAPRTLVCHPGGPGLSGAYFGDMCGLGSERLRLVLLHPRGTGASAAPADGRYELERYAADLDALRDHLGLDSIDLLGHSHGGFVGTVYAAEHPGRVSRLVLLCSVTRFSTELREEARAAFEAHRDRPWYDDARDAQRRRAAGDYASPAEIAALYARELRLWLAADTPGGDALLARVAEARPNLDALRYFNEHLAAGLDLRPRLAQIRAPTLILNGAHDFFGPLVSAREFAAIPGSRAVLLPAAGHWPFAETPDAMRAELQTFLGLA